MEVNYHCPVCGSINWHKIGTREYHSDDTYWQKGYPSIQKTVFFDLWHGKAQSVTLQRNICKVCGFVTDYPRPTEELLNKKYEYLSIVEKDLGSALSISPRVMKNEHRQAVQSLNLAKRWMSVRKNKLTILDYGGGTGHYLVPMINRGHECFIVDYNKHPLKGIKRLGETLNDVSIAIKFDIIICRHVLEHVASPAKIVEQLKKYLNDGGVIYAEVPMQLLGAITPNTDPVTHINYFNKISFRRLFEGVGLSVALSKQRISKYHGKRGRQLQLVASLSSLSSVNALENDGYEETLFYLYKKIRARLVNPIYSIYIFIKLWLSNIINRVTDSN